MIIYSLIENIESWRSHVVFQQAQGLRYLSAPAYYAKHSVRYPGSGMGL